MPEWTHISNFCSLPKQAIIQGFFFWKDINPQRQEKTGEKTRGFCKAYDWLGPDSARPRKLTPKPEVDVQRAEMFIPWNADTAQELVAPGISGTVGRCREVVMKITNGGWKLLRCYLDHSDPALIHTTGRLSSPCPQAQQKSGALSLGRVKQSIPRLGAPGTVECRGSSQ